MKLYILSERHSERQTWCDACNGSSRKIARVLLNGVIGSPPVEIRVCRPCAIAVARAAKEAPR